MTRQLNKAGKRTRIDDAVACIDCDLIVRIPDLAVHQRSLCPRCGHVLSRGNIDRSRHSLPYAICAGVLLPLSLMFPFMSFSRSGIENEMNLVQTAWTLYQDGSMVLSAIVFGFIIVLPACVLTATLLVAFSLNLNRNVRALRPAARFLFTVSTWSMVEVFIIGVLVSLVKIANMASVNMGLSLWTYITFAAFTVIALAKLDKYVVWKHIEELGR